MMSKPTDYQFYMRMSVIITAVLVQMFLLITSMVIILSRMMLLIVIKAFYVTPKIKADFFDGKTLGFVHVNIVTLPGKVDQA